MSIPVHKHFVGSGTSIRMDAESVRMINRCQEAWDALMKAITSRLTWEVKPAKSSRCSGTFQKQD